MADTTLPGLLDVGTHAGRPAASAVGSGGLYSCTDHSLVYQTDGSSWSTWASLTGTGSVATDAIWDAAGDLAVGSGANTAAKLAIGATNGMAVQRVSGAVAWALPPGYEFDYTPKTSDVTVNGTNEAGANTIVTSGSVTYDGSTVVLIHWFAPRVGLGAAAGTSLVVLLYEDSTLIGRIAVFVNPASAAFDTFAAGWVRRTPGSGAHTYTVKAHRGTSDCTIYGASGGTGDEMPGFIRVTKA